MLAVGKSRNQRNNQQNIFLFVTGDKFQVVMAQVPVRMVVRILIRSDVIHGEEVCLLNRYFKTIEYNLGMNMDPSMFQPAMR
jgi:hypothetical protein